ncbi:MAG: YgeY family selenium metabolism-linked hydrolase [Sphaerobacteraceae bacterium]|nr:MAG: YgeY family selenium metabolism-linked hydrolase [Sphaerobacteraceae bacterium]
MTAIDDRRLVALTTELVSHPSLPGAEGNVAEAIKQAITQLDFDEVSIDELGNVVAIRRAESGSGTLLFDGHIDTVSPGNHDLWSGDPHTVIERDGKLIGRGVADMKGAIAAMMLGLSSVPRSELSADIVLSCSVCEEAVEGVALGTVLDHNPADIVIIAESTECELAIGQRGRGELLVETFGSAAHSSTPHLGVNSVKHMAKVISRLSEMEPPHHPRLGYGVMEVTDVKSNPYPGLSVIPEHCAATFDRRLLVGEMEDDILASLQPALDEVRAEIPELQVQVSIPRTDVTTFPGTPLIAPKFSPAWLFEEDHPAVRAALDALEKGNVGTTTRTYSFCTNGSESAGRRNIPTLGYGPGSEEQAHRVDEYVEIEQLVRAAQGYAALARGLGAGIV